MTGTYLLRNGSLVCTGQEIIGELSVGTFTQSGGTNTASTLIVSQGSQSSGTYNLSGGLLSLTTLKTTAGTAAFNFTGGTLQASGTGSVSIGMPLSGAATIDTNGCRMTIQRLVTTPGLTDLNFDLTAPGGTTPLTIGSGGLTLNPNTAISFGATPTTPGDYPLITGQIGSPLLSDFVLPTAPAGERYALALGSGNIDLVVTAVPEPSTFALLGVGAVGFLGYAWRRRKRKALGI